MAAASTVRDSRQHCSLCHFNFWRPTRVFYLGRFEDLVPDPSLAILRARGKTPAPSATVLLGDNYFVVYDSDVHGMSWQLLARAEGRVSPADQVVPFCPPMLPEETASGRPVFPLCRDCFWVVKEFLHHRNRQRPNRPVIASLDGLYAAIYSQWLKTNHSETSVDQRWSIAWPHRSYRGPFVAYDRWERTAPMTLYMEEATGESVDEWHWLVDNPYRPLPSLPNFLLAHLRPTSSNSDDDNARVLSKSADNSSSANHGRFARTSDGAMGRMPPLLMLPNELLGMIVELLEPAAVFSMRLTCRQLAASVELDQRFWYRQLIDNRLFGFFFDFDSMKVMDEMRRRCQKRRQLPPLWDWKRLVGELARFESFQNGGVMADAPGAFRNRRRIWKILEMAEQLCPEDAPSAQRTYVVSSKGHEVPPRAALSVAASA